MSTYLLAWVIGQLDSINSTLNYPDITKELPARDIRIWTVPGHSHEATFALSTALDMIRWYEGYFDIPYPLPKMDLVALPDFSFGAMENWGLLLFRQDLILKKVDDTSAAKKQDVATILAHELAHQWFGNLVTMKWWSHLWLNEGFATFFEYFCTSQIFPDWEMMTQFLAKEEENALLFDSIEHTHALEVDIQRPSEILGVFDPITYNKGASLLRMISSNMGMPKFRNSLRHFLNQFKYSNIETQYLWEAFAQETQNPELPKYLEPWTSQPGYPLIKVTPELGDDRRVLITQHQFSLYHSTPVNNTENLWWLEIPMAIKTDTNYRVQTLLMFSRSMELSIGPNVVWYKANSGQTGFFRATYTDLTWRRLGGYFIAFNVEDKAGLINDALVLARAGLLSYELVTPFVSRLHDQLHPSVWTAALKELQNVAYMSYDSSNTTCYFSVLNYFQSIIPDSRNLNNRTHLLSLLRTRVLNFAVDIETRNDSTVASYLLGIFIDHMQNDHAIPDGLRSAVFKAGAKFYGEEEGYNYVFNR
eukprot:TRINITY_DN1984_c0_g1_i2.p1 TRINITY_DN1984_c0_g1~~TRINITY_DN1984_c0_g1_i2.p1  ORF type:complete len:533 (-),score=88.36 TRINITY_DN1984_c0_g1_i2:251-1849(-)